DVRAQVGADLRAEGVDGGIRALQVLATRDALVAHPLGARTRLGGALLLLSRRGEVGSQAAHRVLHALTHLARYQVNRVGQVRLDADEIVLARRELGAAGVRDGVDGGAALDGLRDQALLLELRQTWVDRARTGGVRAPGAIGQRLDDAVAVLRSLVQQRQQVQSQIAVREDRGGHDSSHSASSATEICGRRSTVMPPETVLARTST